MNEIHHLSFYLSFCFVENTSRSALSGIKFEAKGKVLDFRKHPLRVRFKELKKAHGVNMELAILLILRCIF